MKKSRGAADKTASPPPTAMPVAVPQQLPLVYADAIGNLLVSPIVSRMTLVLNSGPANDGVQPTSPAMEIVIPTPALLTFANQLRNLILNRGADLAKAYESTAKQVAELSVDETKQ